MVYPATSELNTPGSIGDSSFLIEVWSATLRTSAAAIGTPRILTIKAKIERAMPSITIGTTTCRFPTPAALIAVNSLSPCIFESPMMVPTSTAIGHVNAMTFGTRATVNCQIKLTGILALKKISENLPACWTNNITLKTSHENTKYGNIACTKYFEISSPIRFI